MTERPPSDARKWLRHTAETMTFAQPRFADARRTRERRTTFAQPLLQWYDAHRRRLPWREHPSPYRTWISEIMLQQTQVATVLPYYERFLKRFPDVRTLAESKEEDVLQFWAGLGYYSRARNLHRAAQEITIKHNGQFPDDPDKVLALPGIGRYTLGAILSIAFDKPYPVLDGNVARVLSRVYEIRGDIKNGKTRKILWELVEKLMEPQLACGRRTHERTCKHAAFARPGDWNQALMELGALICVPESPHCDRCPIARHCAAKRRGLQEELPEMKSQRKPIPIRWTCLWIERSGRLLLWKRAESERFLPGHWGLPESRHIFTDNHKRDTNHALLGPLLAEIRHTITHHKITASIYAASITPHPLPENTRSVPISNLRRYLVSSVWLKALDKIHSNN